MNPNQAIQSTRFIKFICTLLLLAVCFNSCMLGSENGPLGVLAKKESNSKSNTKPEAPPVNFPDYYALLNLVKKDHATNPPLKPPTPTDAQILKAYKKQAIRVHPDKNRAADAAQKFRELTDAKETLLHHAYKRKLYDNAYVRFCAHRRELLKERRDARKKRTANSVAFSETFDPPEYDWNEATHCFDEDAPSEFPLIILTRASEALDFMWQYILSYDYVALFSSIFQWFVFLMSVVWQLVSYLVTSTASCIVSWMYDVFQQLKDSNIFDNVKYCIGWFLFGHPSLESVPAWKTWIGIEFTTHWTGSVFNLLIFCCIWLIFVVLVDEQARSESKSAVHRQPKTSSSIKKDSPSGLDLFMGFQYVIAMYGFLGAVNVSTVLCVLLVSPCLLVGHRASFENRWIYSSTKNMNEFQEHVVFSPTAILCALSACLMHVVVLYPLSFILVVFNTSRFHEVTTAWMHPPGFGLNTTAFHSRMCLDPAPSIQKDNLKSALWWMIHAGFLLAVSVIDRYMSDPTVRVKPWSNVVANSIIFLSYVWEVMLAYERVKASYILRCFVHGVFGSVYLVITTSAIILGENAAPSSLGQLALGFVLVGITLLWRTMLRLLDKW